MCGGGGYTLKAAQTDKRFKAVATLSMFNSGLVRRNGFMDSGIATIQDRLKQASEARAREAAGGEVMYAAEKELFLIPGATHIQTYYVPEYVSQAMDKLRMFFSKNL